MFMADVHFPTKYYFMYLLPKTLLLSNEEQ
jgi:hypothetical protein